MVDVACGEDRALCGHGPDDGHVEDFDQVRHAAAQPRRD